MLAISKIKNINQNSSIKIIVKTFTKLYNKKQIIHTNQCIKNNKQKSKSDYDKIKTVVKQKHPVFSPFDVLFVSVVWSIIQYNV